MPSSKNKKYKHPPNKEALGAERLRRKLAEGPLHDLPIIIEPEGQVKMSDVLELFVEPYLERVETIEEQRKLYGLAVLAWNASFLAPSEQERRIDEVVSGMAPADAAESQAGLREIMRTLLARRREVFQSYTRRIINFELTETRTGLHLLVASTL